MSKEQKPSAKNSTPSSYPSAWRKTIGCFLCLVQYEYWLTVSRVKLQQGLLSKTAITGPRSVNWKASQSCVSARCSGSSAAMLPRQIEVYKACCKVIGSGMYVSTNKSQAPRERNCRLCSTNQDCTSSKAPTPCRTRTWIWTML